MDGDNDSLTDRVELYYSEVINALDTISQLVNAPHNFRYVLPGNAEIYTRKKGEEYQKLINTDFDNLNFKDKADRVRILLISTYYVASVKHHLVSYRVGSTFAICNFAKSASENIKSKNFLQSSSSFRGLIESIAHFYSVVTKIEEYFEKHKKPSHTDNEPWESYDHYLSELMLLINSEINSNRFKWERAAYAKTILMSKKQRNRKTLRERDEFKNDFEADSIMSAISKLDKTIPGIRSAYDLLCDFVHPNQSQRRLFVDTLKTDSIEEIGLQLNYYGLKNEKLSQQREWSISIEILMCLMEALKHFIQTDDVLEKLLKDLEKITQQYVRYSVKNMNIFCSNDPCPCGSAKAISKCCGKKLKHCMLSDSDRKFIFS